jgi:diacylglycerol O-acyltransferase
VNAFLTNLAGPARLLAFGGLQVSELIPVTVTAGNVSVAFAALSYAGTLTISVIVDPELVPQVSVLTAALDAELEALCAAAGLA